MIVGDIGPQLHRQHQMVNRLGGLLEAGPRQPEAAMGQPRVRMRWIDFQSMLELLDGLLVPIGIFQGAPQVDRGADVFRLVGNRVSPHGDYVAISLQPDSL